MSNRFESYEDYDEGYDDEAYDDDAFEFVESFLPTRSAPVPAYARRLMAPLPTMPYRGIAQLNTPAGPANVALPSDLVSKKEFKALEARVLANNRALLGAGKAIGVLSLNTKKNAAATKKKFAAIQQGQMFSALLPPKLTEVTFNKAERGDTEIAGNNTTDNMVPTKETPLTLEVKSAKFDLMTTLLPMMMSGGMGGGSESGDSGSNMNMMLPMVLLLNQGKDNGNGDDKDNTLLLVMMMMMYK